MKYLNKHSPFLEIPKRFKLIQKMGSFFIFKKSSFVKSYNKSKLMRKNKQTCQPLTFFMLTIHLFEYIFQDVFLIGNGSYQKKIYQLE